MQKEISILPRLRTAGFRVASLAFLALVVSSTATLADLSCDVSKVKGLAPVTTETANPNGFRIFWHVATQIEDLADAANDPARMADIRAASNRVDGYYFNVLLGGPLIYWPDRPAQCALNFNRVTPDTTLELDGSTFNFPDGGEAGRNDCRNELKSFLAKQDKAHDTPVEIQVDALHRVARVLDLADAHKNGHPIWGEIIIRNNDFSYSDLTDKVTINKLPATYCALADLGLPLDGMMIYQEPQVQTRQGNNLWIPRLRNNGTIAYSRNARIDKIPENTRAVALIADAFDAAGVPANDIRVNIRRWNNKRTPRMIEKLVTIPQLGGFNFEGGTRVLVDPKKNVDNFVEGMGWILANTNRDISLLMPGYWPNDKLGNDTEMAMLIPSLRKLILEMNDKLTAKLGLSKGTNAICDSRLVFIPATYGRPTHVKTLPMRLQNGQLAGTVTGQIELLSEMRKELCNV